jgi:hypothetical protein
MKYVKQIGLSIVCLGAMHLLKGMEEQLPERHRTKIKQEKKEKQQTQFTIPIAADSNGTDLVVFFRSEYDQALKTNPTSIGFGGLPHFSFLPSLAAQLNRGEDVAVVSYKDIHKFLKEHVDQKCKQDLVVVPLSSIAQATDLSSIFVMHSINSGEDFKLNKFAYSNLSRQHKPVLVGFRWGDFSGTDTALGKQRVSESTIRVLAEFQKEVKELAEAKALASDSSSSRWV